MNDRKSTILAAVLVGLLTLGVLAQDARQQALDEAGRQVKVWQDRVDDLTSEIIADSSAVSDSEKSIYFGRLATMWWKVDPIEGRKLLKRAEGMATSAFDFEDGEDPVTKVANLNRTLALMLPLDPQAAEAMIERIGKALNARNADTKALSESFIIIGLAVLDKNPQLAFDLAVKSMKVGLDPQLARLIFNLSSKDRKLGEEIALRALAMAGNVKDTNFLWMVGNYAFAGSSDKGFSDRVRRTFLIVLADSLAEATSIESERPSKCKAIVSRVTSLLSRFDEYLPDRALGVRQQVDMCLPFSDPSSAESLKAAARGDEPTTADELIRAARETSDKGLKIR